MVELQQLEDAEELHSLLLKQLYDKSVYVMREAKAEYKHFGIMWAGGKDSTLMLYIARDAFLGDMPPILFLDTSFAFRETYEFIRNIANMWKLKVHYCQNRTALMKNTNPTDTPKMECCTLLKTDALNNCIQKMEFDALMFGIRWDEHPIRGKEWYYSLRDTPKHMRIHPILHWAECDVWNATRQWGLPVNPLYNRNINGKHYYSIGCYPCTQPLSLEEHKRLGERGGRSQDKERIMERLRALGYM